MSEALELGGLTFEVRRSDRRRTVSLTVDRRGDLVVHAPNSTPVPALEQWTRGKLLWVHQKLALKEEALPRVNAPEFVSGEGFAYVGRRYQLRIVNQQVEPLEFDGRRFSLRAADRCRGSELFREWYVSAGTPYVTRRVADLAPRVSASPSRTEVRDLGFRWGSCGKGRVLYFNWRLLQLPRRLIDYVVCHELAHLREPNHGKPFVNLLDRVQPDWRERKSELAGAAADMKWCQAAMG